MKTIVKTGWLLGLLFLLLIVGYSKVAGTPLELAQGPDRPATMPAPVVVGSSGSLPAGLYVFLHQARYESIPVHAMAGVKACPG